MQLVLFENKNVQDLYPLVTLQAIADIRIGIFSFRERWENYTGEKIWIQTRDYLSPLYESFPSDDYIWVDASVLPNEDVYKKIGNLEIGEALSDENGLLAGRPLQKTNVLDISNDALHFKNMNPIQNVRKINFPWEPLIENEAVIKFDIELFTNNKKCISLENFSSSRFIAPENIFISDGAQIDYSIIDAREGPVFIGKNARILAGSLLRGPLVIGEKSVVKMGSKIYGVCSFGPNCTIGGEIKNTIFQGFSNKAHDGYLGDSMIGKWCNIGAGTSVSNVKNTGNDIFINGKNAGKKLGVLMGDYCRTAINTSINTGTITGICSNIFGAGISPNIIPDFNWGFHPGKRYILENALTHISNWKGFKNEILSDAEKNILKYIFAQTK